VWKQSEVQPTPELRRWLEFKPFATLDSPADNQPPEGE